uniref:RAWUL domain-containing protein n=1 Tax=Anopheles dirus TaxID=7168 RepID=A0A182NIE5_9DIPT
CRSCIVKYLECNKYCPRCKSYNSKPITVANLRPDRTLSALVYKLVPGLHKSENQRIVQFYASISSTIVPSDEDDPAVQGTYQLLDDQNFFSPDEPVSLSLEYHADTLAEHSAGSAQLPITYLQCPAAVTVHHLYKFILTKNGLQVGSDNIRVEIIYEDEILPHDFTLMDVAYCFDYKRIAPMRFFYRILIHAAAKLAPTASAYHRVEGQDKNSTNSSAGKSPASGSSTTAKPAPTATGVTDGQRSRSGENAKVGRGQGGSSSSKPASRAPREEVANNSAPVTAVNGHNRATTTSSDTNRPSKTPSPKAASPTTGLKIVLVPKAKPDPIAEATNDSKRSPPPMKTLQASTTPAISEPTKKPTETVPTVAVEHAKPSPISVPKCYVNLKKQTIVEGPASEAAVPDNGSRKQPPAEIPRLKIDLKAKLSVPREKTPGLSPPSSSSSSAATSPSSASSVASSTGKSPVWPMGKEEYAKTIGLKPVYAASAQETQEAAYSSSSSHRKRKKGKHSKEAGSRDGKRRKLHAEISSQHDESLKMKVKITEKPPKHERLKSAGNEEDTTQPKSPPAPVVQEQQLAPPPPPPPPPTPPPPAQAQAPASPPKVAPKVIDITKDDDEVKFVKERKLTVEKTVPPPPATVAVAVPKDSLVTSASGSAAAKDKLNEMRNVRHKPMVYIPNLDRSLSADAPGVSSSINSLLESVAAKVPMLKPTPALIPTSTAASSAMAGKSQPRTPILARPMPSCPPLAYPMVSSPVTSSTSGPIRTMAAPPAIKRSISTDNAGSSNAVKVPRLEPPSLVAPVSLMPAKQPIQAPMFNFAKGANRAKAAQQAAGITPSLPEHVPYRSPISATYTKEIPAIKKPVPNLLLPPATVSVTKMSDIVSSTSSSSSSSSSYDNGRPAVEILRIPPNAPVADKPTLAPFTTTMPKMNVKTTRPPPATIPLIKIKKPTVPGAESTTGTTNPPGMTPISSTIRPKVSVRSASDPTSSISSSNTNILDLSGGTGTGRRLSDDVIILDNSPVKNITEGTNRSRVVDTGRSKSSSGVSFAGVKRPPEMINFPMSTSASTMASQGSAPATVQRTLAPLPKLTEINRHRSLTVRQPNASIRSIPNPSALAFRGTQSGVPAPSVSSTTHAAMMSMMSTLATSSSQQSNGGLTASSRANGNASNAPLTAVKSGVSHSNGSAARQQVSSGMPGISTSNSGLKNNTDSKPVNGAPTPSNNNNNNNSKVANANTGLSAKKTIEKVAAVLKAAAATNVDSSSQRGTSTPSASGSAQPSKPKLSKDGNSSPSPSVASPSTTVVDSSNGDSLSVTTTMSTASRGVAVNQSRPAADGIVTSVTTASVASVTGTNGSSRNSPASIVNVG